MQAALQEKPGLPGKPRLPGRRPLPDKSGRPMTRDRILATAERLFADYGFDGVSLRQIGTAAGAQIALINYHFGTKEMLYRAVFENRINPVSEQRRAALARAMPPHSDALSIEAILDAFARPWIEMRNTEEGRHYTRLIAREVNDPREAERGLVADLLDPIAREFLAAMQQALPGQDPMQVHWAYHVFIGTLLLALANPERVRRLSGDIMTEQPHGAVVDRLVAFVAQSLRATTGPCNIGRAEL